MWIVCKKLCIRLIIIHVLCLQVSVQLMQSEMHFLLHYLLVNKLPTYYLLVVCLCSENYCIFLI